MDDELRVLDEVHELIDDLCKQRLVGEKSARYAVHLERALVDLALRIEVTVEVAPGQATIHEFHASDLDHPMALGMLEPGGFSIQHDLSHQSPCLIARDGAAFRRFRGWPADPRDRFRNGRCGL